MIRMTLVAAAWSVLAAQAGADGIAPSKWGADDQIGAANYLSAEGVLAAAKLITTGKVYRLGVPVDRLTPAFPPRELAVTVLMPNQYDGATFGSNKMSYLDDTFNGWLGIGTQIDSLAHLGEDGVFYNGNKASDFAKVTGVTKLGIEGIPPIVTRGVLIDMAAHRGVERMDEGDVITVEDVEAATKAQGIEIREGDVVVFHTGWLTMLDEDPARFASGEPGINAETAKYLTDKNIVAVGADTWGVEAVPFKTDAVWDAHQVLLAQTGTYILETLDTAELAKDGVTEFFFTLGQPLYTGAVQAIINPIAIR